MDGGREAPRRAGLSAAAETLPLWTFAFLTIIIASMNVWNNYDKIE